MDVSESKFYNQLKWNIVLIQNVEIYSTKKVKEIVFEGL